MAQKVDPQELDNAAIISGPFKLFKGSFVLEFCEVPENLDASVLMRCTYLSPLAHPLNKSRTAHPQSPPLHLHFDQLESFLVTKGELCTRLGYENKEQTWRPNDGVVVVKTWMPHSFHPSPAATDDTIIYLWAHPRDTDEPMDRLFFETLLRYLSDLYESGRNPNLLQIMVTQHASATAMVMFPRAWWLGPLRWWVPWALQGGVAAVGRACGYKALIREYVTEEEWAEYLRAKRA